MAKDLVSLGASFHWIGGDMPAPSPVNSIGILAFDSKAGLVTVNCGRLFFGFKFKESVRRDGAADDPCSLSQGRAPRRIRFGCRFSIGVDEREMRGAIAGKCVANRTLLALHVIRQNVTTRRSLFGSR